MDVTPLLVRGLVLFVALIGLLILVAQRIDAKLALRRLRKDNQPLRRITETERQAVRAVFEIVVAADAPVYRVEGAARQRRVTMNGQEFVRDLIGEVEVRPFRGWEQFLAKRNSCEVVLGGGTALPVNLNGVSLQDAAPEQVRQARIEDRLRHARSGIALAPMDTGDARAAVMLGAKRLETPEEARLRSASASTATGWALLLGLGGAALAMAATLQPSDQWLLAVPALACMVCGLCFLVLRLRQVRADPTEIRTLRGPLTITRLPRRDKAEFITRIGELELLYAGHWLLPLARHDGQVCEVDIDMRHRVVRHERLSLYDERRQFPVPRWGWRLAALSGACATLALCVAIAWPLTDAFGRATSAWRGVRTLQATTPAALLAQQPRPWDRIAITGIADCLRSGDAGSDAGEPTAQLSIRIVDSIDGLSPSCPRLGWRSRLAEPRAFPLLTEVVALREFAQAIRPLPGNDVPPPQVWDGDDHGQAAMYADLEPSTLPVTLRNLGAHMLELDQVCAGRDDDPCKRIRDAIATLSGHPDDWKGAVADAAAGKIADARVPPRGAKLLAQAFDELLLPALQQAERERWGQARRAMDPELVLQLDGGNGLVPQQRPALDSSDALANLLNYAFRLDGTVVSLRNDGHGPPVLAVRAEATPPNGLAIYLPLLLGVLALATMLGSGFALWRALHRRKAMQPARVAYVEAQLG